MDSETSPAPIPRSRRAVLFFCKLYAYTLPCFAAQLLVETLGVVDGSGFVFGIDGGYRWFCFAYSISFVVLYALLALMWSCVWCMRPPVPERWIQGVVFQLLAAGTCLWMNVTPSIDFPDTRKRVALVLALLYLLTWAVQRMHWTFLESIEIQHDTVKSLLHLARLVHEQTQHILYQTTTIDADAIQQVQRTLAPLDQRVRELEISLDIRKV